MKIGLIGLSRSGKTTLFNLLTGANVATSRFETGRVELHTGVARVPEQHSVQPLGRQGVTHATHVVGQAMGGHASVLHDLHGADMRVHARQDRAGRVSQRLQGLFGFVVEPEEHRRGSRCTSA